MARCGWGNFTAAFISACLAWAAAPAVPLEKLPALDDSLRPQIRGVRMAKTILFSTGFVAMAMEVVWSRAFTPVLKTQVYSFAMIVFTYLGATFFGSWMYRRDLRNNRRNSTGKLIFALALTSFLPVLANNPELVVTDYWVGTIDVFSVVILGSILSVLRVAGIFDSGPD
jgi:hypothetical protein